MTTNSPFLFELLEVDFASVIDTEATIITAVIFRPAPRMLTDQVSHFNWGLHPPPPRFCYQW